MNENSLLVLDKERIAFKMRRMAYEIWERNSDEQELTLIGIEHGGKILSDNLTEILREICPLVIHNIAITINKKNHLNHALDFEDNLSGRAIVLIDDVINSGKTIMYSLHAILSFDIKKLMVAVLVDRKHKSFPISSDIVGHTISTTLQNRIDVKTEGNEIVGVYLA